MGTQVFAKYGVIMLTLVRGNKPRTVLYPFADNARFNKHAPIVMSHADGVFVWDDNNKRYLDAFAGLWCVNVGYGRRELVRAASNQMSVLPYYNSFFNTTTAPTEALSRAILKKAPKNMSSVFFTNSGSEANDSVFRLVRRYWDIKKQPTKKHFIARTNGYHGSTVAGASLGGMKPMHAQGDLPISGISHINQPYWFEEGRHTDEHTFGLQRAQELETEILRLGPENVAAFIAEPIQGAGGVIIPPKSYWPEIQRICKKYHVLLVADEVICGFGRTGHWFGSQALNIEPDLMSIAKGLSSGYLPIGGVVISREITTTMQSQDSGDWLHGFTYSGHPTCAAVALENLRILEQELVVETVRYSSGPYMADRLAQLVKFPIVGQVRSEGLIGAIELVADQTTQQRFEKTLQAGSICRDIALELGLILRATGDTMLISPPLTITQDELALLFDLIEQVLNRTWQKLTTLSQATENNNDTERREHETV